MEEAAPGQCRVIYYCHGLSHTELYTPAKPPAATNSQDGALPDGAYNNVRRLLDVDQGNFGQGKASPSRQVLTLADASQSSSVPSPKNASSG